MDCALRTSLQPHPTRSHQPSTHADHLDGDVEQLVAVEQPAHPIVEAGPVRLERFDHRLAEPVTTPTCIEIVKPQCFVLGLVGFLILGTIMGQNPSWVQWGWVLLWAIWGGAVGAAMAAYATPVEEF